MTMLLEKAARAICNSCCQECEPGDDCGGWSTWEREARAAIVAIHEHLSKPSLVMWLYPLEQVEQHLQSLRHQHMIHLLL